MIYSVGQLAQMACVAEVCAPKAGNVHPGADFEDVSWLDFVTSALVCRPIWDRAVERGVGATVLNCVQATREAVGTNTNLGLVLLLSPLCVTSPEVELATGIRRVLASLTDEDTRLVYEAIRLADPGGLGQAPRGDVRTPPTLSLLEAMHLAADRDAVARQYVNQFQDVLDTLAPALAGEYREGVPLDQVIVRGHLLQMAFEPDSLIGRKCGQAVAREAQQRAAQVVAAPQRFGEFDAWLRADGHRRNPGASADLIAAALFVAFREGLIEIPFAWSRSLDECL